MFARIAAKPHAGMSVLLIVWLGQLVSLLGSGLSGFALGLWTIRQGGSVTEFAWISVCTVLPGVLLSPVAGALVDRWEHRRTMAASELGAGIATLALTLLQASNRLEIWHIYVAVSLISILAAFQWPAYIAATTILAPEDQLANASGLVQMAQGVARTGAPVLAGLMIASSFVGIHGVLLADTISYAFALVTLLAVRFPERERIPEQGNGRPSLVHEIAEGWVYLWKKPGLLALLAFLSAINFMMGIIMVLVTPLVLSFADAKVLGEVMSTAGVGMFVGSVLISVWGGPKRRIAGVFWFLLLSGASLIPAGLPASAMLIGAGAFMFMLGVPVINGCSQAILQSKVALGMQGRVFATTQMVVSASLPLAFAAAGTLADWISAPLMTRGGAWAATAGSLVGVGPGRGVALIFVLSGVLLIGLTAAGWFYQPLRRVEDEPPDTARDTAVEVTPQHEPLTQTA